MGYQACIIHFAFMNICGYTKNNFKFEKRAVSNTLKNVIRIPCCEAVLVITQLEFC